MIRSAFWFALALLVAACTPSHSMRHTVAATPDVEVPHTHAAADLESKTVALVEVDSSGEGGAYCSGVWVGDDTILTANHCVSELLLGDRLSYLTRGDLYADKEDEIEAARLGVLVARDESHDLALVRAPFAPPHGVARVASQTPYVGEPVQTEGHPLGQWYSYSIGVVSAVRKSDGVWYVQSQAPISPGNSGGGLFDAYGDLLGVCHAYMPRGENMNFYIHAVYVRAFLEAWS